MKNRWVNYLLHAFGWAFLYILPYLFSFEGLPNVFTMFSHPGDYIHAVSFFFLIAFIYTNHLQLVPKFYFRAKYISYIILLGICFWVVVELPVLVVPKVLFRGAALSHEVPLHQRPRGVRRERPPADINEFPPPPHRNEHKPPRGNGPKQESHPFLFGKNYTILLFVLGVIGSLSIHTRKHIHKIEKEKLNAELSLLKAQINPHFLFNTLNSIYALVISKDEKAADAIVQLSELMRYTLKDTVGDLVDLDKEVNYIKNYIALQEARLGDTVKVEQNISGNLANKKIPPLLLVTFIENAFKHGVNPNEASEIIFDLLVEDTHLRLFVKNKQVSSSNGESGIGLRNVKERLQLLYPSNHTLIVDDSTDSYSVELLINL